MVTWNHVSSLKAETFASFLLSFRIGRTSANCEQCVRFHNLYRSYEYTISGWFDSSVQLEEPGSELELHHVIQKLVNGNTCE
jgi:hypothetical protein